MLRIPVCDIDTTYTDAGPSTISLERYINVYAPCNSVWFRGFQRVTIFNVGQLKTLKKIISFYEVSLN